MPKLVAALVLAVTLIAPTAAQAAPPPNDDRGRAQALGALPSTVRGTTVDATNEPGEPPTCAGVTEGSVWYQLNGAAAARDLVLEFDAAGDLDATVDLYRRERSQLTSLDCGQTNRRGRLTLDFGQPRSAELLIRVAPRANSARDAFTMRVVAPDAPERPPGRALGSSGASGSLDRIANPDDAYGISMSAGRTYRVHVVSRDRCVNAALYPPGTSSFEGGDAVRGFDCDDYFLYTPGPGEGGRYSVQVLAPRSRRGALPYHLHVARAGEDDTGARRRAGQRRPRARRAARRRGRRGRPVPLRRAAPEHPRPAAAGRRLEPVQPPAGRRRGDDGSPARAAPPGTSRSGCGSSRGATTPRSGPAAGRTGATSCRA